MKHLQTKREAAERRRVALMSKGISDFLDRTTHRNAGTDISQALNQDAGEQDISTILSAEPYETRSEAGQREPSSKAAEESTLDKIRVTLDEAADILRESLELVVGGVVFLDPTVGYSESEKTEAYGDISTDIGAEVLEQELAEKGSPSQLPINNLSGHLSSSTVRSAADKHKPAKVLSMSAAEIATWDSQSSVLDGKTLQTIINSYPNGNVWYIDDEGYFTSLEQMQ